MERSSKKKLSDESGAEESVVDPLAGLQATFDNYDIKRTVSIYADNSGERWWTKAWFNGREKGEPSIEISKQLAIAYIHDDIKRDDWLSRFYPKQMSIIRKSIEQTRQQLLGY